jgi:hypothetical protein
MADAAFSAGFNELVKQLDGLGRQGDVLARKVASSAARWLRDSYVVQALSGSTGLSSAIVRKGAVVKAATVKYPSARINFSSSGILVREFNWRARRTNHPTRAQILVDWIGGSEKVAAGFVNPRGAGVPLSTRNQRAAKNGKVYTYRKGKMTEAMGPSLAAAYLALPESDVASEAVIALNNELSQALDRFFSE